MDVKKSEGSPFYNFRHYETAQNSHFRFLPKTFKFLRRAPLHFLGILQQNGFTKSRRVLLLAGQFNSTFGFLGKVEGNT